MTTIGSTSYHLARETKFFNLDNVFATSLLCTILWGLFLSVWHGEEVEEGADPSNDDCRLLEKTMNSFVRPVGVCPAGDNPIGDLMFVRFPGARGLDQVSDVCSGGLLL